MPRIARSFPLWSRSAIAAAAAVASGLLWLACPPAFAAALHLSPVVLHLDAESPTRLLTLMNPGDRSISVEISVWAWALDESGEDVTTETGDLIAFPEVFKLEAGETRVVRVGSLAPVGADEKTFRLFIDELPQDDAAQGATVRLLTQFSLPVFVGPAAPAEPRVVLEPPDLSGGLLSFRLANTGNAHVGPHSVHVLGHSRDGGVLIDEALEGWYLLSDSSRPHSVPLPSQLCRALDRLTFAVEGRQSSQEWSLTVTPELCGST